MKLKFGDLLILIVLYSSAVFLSCVLLMALISCPWPIKALFIPLVIAALAMWATIVVLNRDMINGTITKITLND